MKRLVCILLVCALALGCRTRPAPIHQIDRDYQIGNEVTAVVGMPFVHVEMIETRFRRHFPWWGFFLLGVGGFLFQQWRENKSRTVQELVYNGRADDTILVAFRETKFVGARPGVVETRDLHYDLSRSPVMVFRSYRMKIVEATNERIRVVVLSDGQVVEDQILPGQP